MWFGLQQLEKSGPETSSIFYVDSDYESLSQQTSTKIVMFMRSMYEEVQPGLGTKNRPVPQQQQQQRPNQLLPPAVASRNTSFFRQADEMESEVRGLRQEVSSTKDSLRTATRRCRELVRELEILTAEHNHERRLRDQQLSRILRALLVLESRLKHEQKSIRQLLHEKDSVIRDQQLEIARLRRLTKNYIKGQRDQGDPGGLTKDKDVDGPVSLESTDFQEDNHESELGKDIQKLKHEIISKLNDSMEEPSNPPNIHKTHSFAGSDISKASLTSSEITDASIITTTTDGAGSPSLLSTEGFCEGESTDDLSPGSTLNKSSLRCTPSILTTDSETETTLVMLDKTKIERSESKDDGMDCNYVSDDDDDDEALGDDEDEGRSSVYSKSDRLKGTTGEFQDCTNNNNNNNSNSTSNQVQVTLSRLDSDEQNNDESSGNWYSDPDEDRLNDELVRHSVYKANPSKHNSVLECVNQILLHNLEDEENNRVLSMPRRFKHRGKIVRFQPARLSDIESVGSEMERRNSEEPPRATTPSSTVTSTAETDTAKDDYDDDNDVDEDEHLEEGGELMHEGFEATNSEDEFGMRIVPALDPESGLEEDVDDMKARPIVIIEPCTDVDQPQNYNIKKSLKSNKSASPTKENMEKKFGLPKSCSKGLDNIAKNLDYEEIESLPDILSKPSMQQKTPPALPPKPQFRNSSTLILKKIPSPSFLIDETKSHKKLNNDPTKVVPGSAFVVGVGAKNPIPIRSVRSLKFSETVLTNSPPKKNSNVINNLNINNPNEDTSFWKNRFNNVRSSFQLIQPVVPTASSDSSEAPPTPTRNQLPPKVTNIVKQFEEFKIDNTSNDVVKKPPSDSPPDPPTGYDVDDIQENFEEFNLDECIFTEEHVGLPESSVTEILNENSNNNSSTATNTSGGNYDNFLEATGLSNKSILTPSRLLSNHKSMLKPKDVKYKSKIKATAVMERHGTQGNAMPVTSSSATSTKHTKHWTGPFV